MHPNSIKQRPQENILIAIMNQLYDPFSRPSSALFHSMLQRGQSTRVTKHPWFPLAILIVFGPFVPLLSSSKNSSGCDNLS